MSKRTSFWLAILILLIGVTIRLTRLASLPPGMSIIEAQDVQIAELVRLGRVEVLYVAGDEGREGLYHTLLSVVTAFIGNHPFGYRMFSIWMGLLSIALVYSLTCRLYGRGVGLLAMAALMVPLWSVFLSRTIARETMLPFIVTVALTTLTHALPTYRRYNLVPSTIPFAFLGLALGLGFYVHPAHYIIVLACMVFIAYMVLTGQRMSRRTLSYLSFAIVILVIVATPYLISSLRLSGLNGANRLLAEYQIVAAQGVGQTILNNLGGFFIRGDANILHNVPYRPYMDPISGLLMIGGLLLAIRHISQPRYAVIVIFTVLLLPIALLSPGSPNFMGYSVFTPILAILVALGGKQLYHILPYQRILVMVGVVLVLLNVGWTAHSLFSNWGRDGAVKAAYNERLYQLATYLDDTVSNTSTVVCAPELPSAIPVWHAAPANDAALLALMMDNPDEQLIRYVDCGSGMVFTRGGAHQQVILLEPDMLDKLHPYVRDWVEEGDLITQDLPPQSVVSMIVDQRLGDTIGLFTTTAPTGYAPESPGGVAPALLPINLSDPLTFLGYEDQEDAYAPGEVATMITYWRVDGVLPHDLSIFTHVLFDAQTIVSQTDTISVRPDRLKNRDVFVQVTFVPIPENLPPGTYQTSTGAYEQNEDVRLSVLDNGRPRGTRLFLDEITVQ